ncbi:MAG: hypothetical protein ACYTGQ_07045 [Planctomycetota bacterium]|jgi:hypothetical protein
MIDKIPPIGRVALLAAGIACMTNAAPQAQAQVSNAEPLLTEAPWRDYAHGLSLKTPLDANTVSLPTSEMLLRVVGPGESYMVTLKVITPDRPMSLNDFTTLAHEQLVKVHDSAKTIAHDDQATIADRPAHTRYYQLIPILSMQDTLSPIKRRANQSNELIFANVSFPVNARDYAVFEFYCDIADVKHAQPIFEAMLASTQIADLKAIEQQRQLQIERGQRLLDQVRLHELAENLPPERHYRLLDNGRDYGYSTVTCARAEEHFKPGIAIVRRGRIVRDNKNIDTLAKYFISLDRTLEMWSLETIYKPAGANRVQNNPFPSVNNQTHAETGIRTGADIRVTINGFNRSDHFAFAMPPKGYISQVELLLLPRYVPMSRATYSFYAYNHQLGKITLRTESVIPVFDSFTLNSRPSPNELVTRSTYSTHRQLKQLNITDTKKQIPTTAAERRLIWSRR